MGQRYELKSYEYSGRGWFGEVYEFALDDWSWFLVIDNRFGSKALRCQGFATCEGAERSMRARLALLVKNEHVQLGLPVNYQT